jgi:type I restriction enzyme R subunit
MKNEAQTRKEIIDKRLLEAGWRVDDRSQVIQEFDIEVGLPKGVEEPKTRYQGHQFSDYVLLGRNGKPLAVVEAKKTSVDAAIGREQAKQYCLNIVKTQGGELPFCFYTNGHEIYFWDLENASTSKSSWLSNKRRFRKIQLRIEKQESLYLSELINTKIAGSDYQLRAIRSVMDELEKKRRKFLLVMATGTGKTRTCIALTEALDACRVGRESFVFG